jgi:cytochrome c oxidase subunit IV
MSTTLQVPPHPSFSHREVLYADNLSVLSEIEFMKVQGFWAWEIILRFLRLEVSTFVFAFLQNAIHEKT